ncbi:MADS-box transcription factor 23 [Dendrobium catenatum]|uniref:MADS-box transcription factor 23 n=1 Tax=Dendrobium catenatum TaxID=906689 RepID=A0A2I0X9H1_9ASPA|nr:MADS-box transcription factor 23 [Dendrobium catenatum]
MAGKGRKKLDNKLIEKAEARMVCFSKRRKGLFKKAEELSILSGAKIGILTFSQAGKLYCSDAEILNSLLCSQVGIPPDSLLRREFEISPEKEAGNHWEFDFAEAMAGKNLPFWFNRVDAQIMSYEELQRFERAILEYAQMQQAKTSYK